MTIGVGFLCSDGVVLAADTKESYGGFYSHVHKILEIAQPHCTAAIVGSGLAWIVDYVTGKIQTALSAELSDNAEVENALRLLMAEIYASDPLRVFPAEASEKVADFLIAVRPKDRKPALYCANSSLIRRVTNNNGCVVIGYSLLKDIGERLHSFDLNVEQAALAALYLVYEAKQRYSDVGGETELVKITSHGIGRERPWDQAEREFLFRAIQRLHHLLLLGITNYKMTDREFTRFLRMVSKEAKAVRSEHRRIEKKYRQLVSSFLQQMLHTSQIHRG
jgi:hypothetical protein